MVLGENARAAVEMQRRANDMRNTRSRPKRRASHDVGNARDPINRSGMVVRSEAVAWERPNSCRMDGKIGPMETIAGRRSMATNTIARIASRLCMAFGSPRFSLTSGLAIISVVISLLLITLRDSFKSQRRNSVVGIFVGATAHFIAIHASGYRIRRHGYRLW